MPDFSPMYSYGAGLSILGVLAWVASERALTHAMLVLLASWLLWCSAIMVTSGLTGLGLLPHHHYPWYIGIGIDAFAAWSLSRDPTNKIKATVAAIFCVQIAMHMAFGTVTILHGSADGELYAQHLSVTGWIELLLLGGWSVGSAGGRLYRFWRVVHPSRSASHLHGLDGTP